jgi:hypothetical protein
MVPPVGPWWAARRGYDFPRMARGGTVAPLRPRALSRALVRAARADERAESAAGAAGAAHAAEPRVRPGAPPGSAPGATAPGPRSAAAVAALSEEDRRTVALRIQRERAALSVADREERISAALAAARCGWRAPQVEELFRLALRSVDPVHPAPAWRPDAPGSLELPLAAFEELSAADRERLHPYLRTVLAMHHFDLLQRPAGTPVPPRRRALVERVRALLPSAYDVDGLLAHRDAYATAVRQALGATAYRPEIAAFVGLCAEVTGARPSYAWLGRVRELVQREPGARAALAPLLRSVGVRLDGPGAVRHEDAELTEDSGRLLTGAAWAACVAERVPALRDLERALSRYAGRPPEELSAGAALFLRGGLAALAALAGEPADAADERLLATASGRPGTAAAEALRRLRRYPAELDPAAMSVAVGAYTAHFTVDPTGRVSLGFRNEQGVRLLHVPRRVRTHTPAAYAALRARVAELTARTTAFKGSLTERLHDDPGQPWARWRALHLDPPLLEPLTRALVWQADTVAGPVVGLPVRRGRAGGWALRDLRGRFHEVADSATVRLWDPRGADAAEVAAWTAALRRRRLVQPVPQLPPGK